jgi:hypothetical protein
MFPSTSESLRVVLICLQAFDCHCYVSQSSCVSVLSVIVFVCESFVSV